MLTLMAVHAHPDDEVISTGGVLARASAAGHRTVLVTCTGGEAGDGPGGIKPTDPAHDAAEVARTRRRELDASCAILGIGHVEMLGYADTGLPDWPTAGSPLAFGNASVDDARARLDEIIRRWRPDVLVTYDENGGSGHADHVMAHRVAMASVASTGIPRKVYWGAIARSTLEAGHRAMEAMREAGADLGDGRIPPPEWGVPDDRIAAVVDVSVHSGQKRAALGAHASQADGAFLLGLPAELRDAVFSRESFVRAVPAWEGGTPEGDLFDGLGPA